MTIYANTSAGTIASSGGSVRVILGTTTDNRGNGGTSLPCKGCFVQAADSNTDVVKMNIDAAATDDLGVDLSRTSIDSNQATSSPPLFVPIDDVAKLYFYSGDGDGFVDILWLAG